VPDELAWKGAYSRFRHWSPDNTWQQLLTGGQADADAARELDWLAYSVDSTVARAHQHAAGLSPGKTPHSEPADHSLGRSRGGLSTKTHVRLSPDVGR
jgi:hypothetical protein